MIIRIKPDRQKSESLRKMAKITLERLSKTEMDKYPSNTLLDYYDAIHKLMDAFAIKNGIKIKGDGAHKEIIEYLFKEHKIDEQTRHFLQQMREYRNQISYEGFTIPKNYIILNREKILEIIKNLIDLLN